METLENKIYKEALELEKKGELSLAIQSYRKALSQNPKSLLILQALVKCYLKQKEYSEALIYFQKVVKIYPSEENFYNEAECLLALGQVLEAVRSLKKAVSINPAYLKANLLLVKIYSQVENYFQLEKYLQLILKMDPKNTFALKRMALLCEKTNRPKEALSYLEGYMYQTEETQVESEILQVGLLLKIGKYATAWENLYETMKAKFSIHNPLKQTQTSLLEKEVQKIQLELKNNSLKNKPLLSFQLSILYLMMNDIYNSSKYLIYSKKLNEELKLSRVKIENFE